MASPVLGIDLGTTNSVVAYADETRVRVLRDEEGRLLTPSTVSFMASGDVKVGQPARDMRLIDAQSTVYSVKRLIGQPFRSPEVRQAAKLLPFKLEEGPTGGVNVRVRAESFSLPEISSFILRRLRDIADIGLGQPCHNAVITVPANFNELQRMATRDAGRIAGLNVLRILNEPTAAALAYGYRAQQQERIAVYDFGGGTFDISILELSGDVIEVVATAGDTHLGGDDLDRAIADRMATQFQAQHGIDLTQAPESYGRLTLAAEWIKCQLSDREAAEATIKKLAVADGAPLDLKFRLGQREWEELASPLIARTFAACEDALRLAGVRPSQLDAVLLVGGQTRTPRVRELVREFFGMEPKFSVDPDLAVAHGAALQGYALAGVPAAEPERRVRTLAGGTQAKSDNPFADEPTRVNGPEELADAGRKARRSDNPFEEQGAKPGQGRLPSLRPERPMVPHAQTLAGVGDHKASDTTVTSESQPAPGSESESDLPAALRAQPEADEDPKTSTLLDSPKAKARVGARTGSSLGPRPASPARGDLQAARALAARGELQGALALYGELLLRDPNDPLLLSEARALRAQLKAARTSQVPQPSAAPPAGRVAPPPAPDPAGARGAARAASSDPRVTHPSDPRSARAAGARASQAAGGRASQPTAERAASRSHVPDADPAPSPRARVDDGGLLAGPPSQPELRPSQPTPVRKAAPPPPPPPRSRRPEQPSARAPSATPTAVVAWPEAAPPAPPERRPSATSELRDRTASELQQTSAPANDVAVSRWTAAPVGVDPIALAPRHMLPANELSDAESQFPGPPSVAPLLLDVTPHTLCVETVGGFCEQIIERNAPIPTEQTRLFTTSRDNQVTVSVRVCQGESRRTDDNQVLGQFELLGLRPARRGEVSIAVTFVIDADGTLNVRALDEGTGRGQDLRVSLTGAIEPEELERLRLRLRSLAS